MSLHYGFASRVNIFVPIADMWGASTGRKCGLLSAANHRQPLHGSGSVRRYWYSCISPAEKILRIASTHYTLMRLLSCGHGSECADENRNDAGYG